MVPHISKICNNKKLQFNVVYRTDRYCKRTTVINGVTIPKGAIIAVPISMLHHSPLYWKDPEKFDPNRYIATVTVHALTDPDYFLSSHILC